MRLLMHICCANCALFPIRDLKSKGIEFRGLWFNPNIHLFDEYSKRLDALRRLQALWGLDIEYIDYYGLDEFVRLVHSHKGIRCEVCYTMRLEKTAQIAKKMGLDGFTTTLLVSPYQRFELIKEIGEDIGKRHSIRFYLEDYRVGYREGVKISKELGLYRQKYCGCVFSEAERKNHLTQGAKNG